MARLSELAEFLEEVSGPEWVWYAKHLSPNDTQATGSHQAGPLIGNRLFAVAFPHLLHEGKTGKRGIAETSIPAYIDSHHISWTVRVVWYRSKGEGRLTGWGGSSAPLQKSAETGRLVLFAFAVPASGDADSCRIWHCKSPPEEDVILERLGAPEPYRGVVFSPAAVLPRTAPEKRDLPCALEPDQLPERWAGDFPSGEEIAFEAAQRVSSVRKNSADMRLVRRISCEYELFLSVERAAALPHIRRGFKSVAELVSYANVLTNRRKARAGRSLELQIKLILDEEGIEYSWGRRTEGKRTPDFIFPSIERYLDPEWPADRLRMLAAKRTLKDRWRQILREADRITTKHLLTLQPGVSEAQFREISDANVVLVVPNNLHDRYPQSVRPHLITVSQFIAEIGLRCD